MPGEKKLLDRPWYDILIIAIIAVIMLAGVAISVLQGFMLTFSANYTIGWMMFLLCFVAPGYEMNQEKKKLTRDFKLGVPFVIGAAYIITGIDFASRTIGLASSILK